MTWHCSSVEWVKRILTLILSGRCHLFKPLLSLCHHLIRKSLVIENVISEVWLYCIIDLNNWAIVFVCRVDLNRNTILKIRESCRCYPYLFRT